MVTGSDWFQLFFPKGVLPNIKLRVPIILSSAFLGFCVELYQILLVFSVFFELFQCKQKIKMSTKTFATATIF